MPAATVTGRVLTSPKVLIGGYDLSGYHNKITADISKEMLPAQQFGATGRQRKAGLWDMIMTHSGFWEGGATTIDGILRDLPSSNVLTLCPQSGAMGEKSAWFCNIKTAKYETGGKVGGLTSFTGSAVLQDGNPVLNGTILKAAEITTSGTGTAYELSAVTGTQYMYGALHVTATSGASNRTLTVVIQSDEAEAFEGPTTQLSFTQATTSVTAEFLTPVIGPVTDTWWRCSYTRGGDNGTFTMYCLFAIL